MSTATSPQRPPSPAIFNIPNQLTGLRFILSIVLFALIHFHLWPWCLLVFVVAAITDWLDGYLARRWNLGSTLGRNLDPLVDKILICGAFVFLIPISEAGVTPWMVVLVISRELVVTSLRSFIENQGGSFGAAWPGKLKMGLQCIALIGVFLYLWYRSFFLYLLDDGPPYVQWNRSLIWWGQVCDVLIYAMLASTVISGLQYLLRAVALLRTEE